MVTDQHRTVVSYIEHVLNIKYTGTTLNDLAKFISENFQKARLKEPPFKEWLLKGGKI